MAGQKAHFYYFVFLAGSLCCVFGSNENDYDHLGKVISDRSKEYYEYEWRNEVHGEVDNASEQPGDNPADLKPVQENKMDDKKSTENAAAQSQNQSMAMQSESPKPIQDEYHDLLKNWRALLVSEEFDATNVAAVKFVNKLSEEAESLYRNLDKKSVQRVFMANRGRRYTLSGYDHPISEITETRYSIRN
ncbi:uncharacterized protein LOC125227722 isoform X2 [Leguminivora glycinivorella]|uniref:uncharacterized protein LOC125227722 isoform X2 n=1 Tax=Leguminivora glycinivorella TaxID=1035111 RepID=UPI00200C56F9|nr:uncharacterized protein LOC125227722 isoform X2 [Leguminivora glycinivorella]